MTFEFEHILPLSAGGETVFENLWNASPSCNRHKGERQTAIEPESGEAVALFHPQEQVWTEHFAWSETGAEMRGLTAVGRATIAALQMNLPALFGQGQCGLSWVSTRQSRIDWCDLKSH